MKEANLFGRKTVCGRWDSKDVNPENIRVFPLSGFSMVKPVRRMSVRPKIVLRRLKNRLAENGKSFGADCTGMFACHKVKCLFAIFANIGGHNLTHTAPCY